MGIMDFNLVLLWKLEFFEKWQNDTNFGKHICIRYYTHMWLVCIVVEAFEIVWLVLSNNLENDKTIRT